ncbi:MAG: transposase [Alphaproteobacteria bacterium]|nr:transposase [Alphaproteobacteria bacterium]
MTNYADQAGWLSHDKANRFLRDVYLPPRRLWESAKDQIVPSEQGFVVFDDTVLDKRYARDIEGIRSQYSGNAHDIIRGIGVVTCLYVNPDTDQFWAIDWRIFDPDKDGKSKNDHVREMLTNLHHHKKLPYRAVLMDTWYATQEFMLMIEGLSKLYYCPLKINRLVDDSRKEKPYRPVGDLEWSEKEQKEGKTLKIKNSHRPPAFAFKC